MSDMRRFCRTLFGAAIAITVIEWLWTDMPARSIADIAASRLYMATMIACVVVSFSKKREAPNGD